MIEMNFFIAFCWIMGFLLIPYAVGVCVNMVFEYKYYHLLSEMNHWFTGLITIVIVTVVGYVGQRIIMDGLALLTV